MHHNKKRTTTRRRRFPRLKQSEQPVVSVVIPAMNEQRTIGRAIYHAGHVHPDTEVIVVANGSTDGTGRIAARAGARVIEFSEPLGHDVGRSIGARAAKGDIIVFMDGDFVISANQLRPLVEAVKRGTDVALNRYTGPTRTRKVHNVILAKHALNSIIHRPDLGGASMTTIPHALSRRALAVIGTENLAVPPKALALAALHGLNIYPAHYIDVGRPNPRKRRKYRKDPLETLIVGDHLEAVDCYVQATDERGHHTDLSRLREKVR